MVPSIGSISQPHPTSPVGPRPPRPRSRRPGGRLPARRGSSPPQPRRTRSPCRSGWSWWRPADASGRRRAISRPTSVVTLPAGRPAPAGLVTCGDDTGWHRRAGAARPLPSGPCGPTPGCRGPCWPCTPIPTTPRWRAAEAWPVGSTGAPTRTGDREPGRQGLVVTRGRSRRAGRRAGRRGGRPRRCSGLASFALLGSRRRVGERPRTRGRSSRSCAGSTGRWWSAPTRPRCTSGRLRQPSRPPGVRLGRAGRVAPAAASPLYFPRRRPNPPGQQVYLSGTLNPDTAVDIAAVLDRKTAALACHRSQLGEGQESGAELVAQRRGRRPRPRPAPRRGVPGPAAGVALTPSGRRASAVAELAPLAHGPQAQHGDHRGAGGGGDSSDVGADGGRARRCRRTTAGTRSPADQPTGQPAEQDGDEGHRPGRGRRQRGQRVSRGRSAAGPTGADATGALAHDLGP